MERSGSVDTQVLDSVVKELQMLRMIAHKLNLVLAIVEDEVDEYGEDENPVDVCREYLGELWDLVGAYNDEFECNVGNDDVVN